MEFAFVCDNAADSSFLAQELELTLRDSGVSADALSLRQASKSNMDIGSVLLITSSILAPMGSLATIAKCVYEVVAKHNSPVVIVHSGGERIEIAPENANLERIKKALAEPVRSNSKS